MTADEYLAKSKEEFPATWKLAKNHEFIELMVKRAYLDGKHDGSEETFKKWNEAIAKSA